MPFLGSQPAEAALSTGHLSDDIVTEAKMANDAIGFAELKAGTDGELITWDASGNPAAVAVGTATHVLTSNGAGAAPTFQAAAAGGLVKQIQSVSVDQDRSTTSTTRADITDLTVTVTSLISSDKVLLTGVVSLGQGSSTYSSFVHLDRGGTEIGQGASQGSRRRVHTGANPTNNVVTGVSINYLDSPSATGSVVYKVQFSTESSGTAYVNRSGSDTNNSNHMRSVCTLTALVIDGS